MNSVGAGLTEVTRIFVGAGGQGNWDHGKQLWQRQAQVSRAHQEKVAAFVLCASAHKALLTLIYYVYL